MTFCSVLLLSGTIAIAQEKISSDKPAEAAKPAVTLKAVETDDGKVNGATATISAEKSISTHVAEIGGKSIRYTATAGNMALLGADRKKKADVFFIAYTVEPAKDQKRPITFCFNGGPGSSSVWLHMGMLGPKRVKLDSHAGFNPPPHEVIANPYSLLDITDLVFIDPVSTGFSRPAEGEKKEQFHGFREDLEAVGKFIERYTTSAGRWGSPKFLCGESYGTLRAAALSSHLHDEFNLDLNGIVLVSSVLDFQTLSFGNRNDLPNVLFLPTYTATAWYHKKLDPELQKQDLKSVVAHARQFAEGAYLQALLQGNRLPRAERKKVVAEMARLTGLSPRFVEQSDLRVTMGRFGEELLKKDRKILGRFDSRYIAADADDAGSNPEFDPSAAWVFGAFTSAMNQYFHETLQVKRDYPYEILTGNVQPWNYGSFTNKYVDVTAMLSSALAENPALRVFVANGYYDLATPFSATEYTFAHLRPQPARNVVTTKYYEGGHMMYVHEPSLEKLRQDLLKFYESTLNTRNEP